jgi:hypothetical protein
VRKIVGVAPFKVATRQEILRFLREHPNALIILPGNYANTPSPGEIQRLIRRETVVFAEGGETRDGRSAFIITRKKVVRMPSQVFANAPTARDMDELAALLPQRTIRLGKRRATFFICGEIMGFNPDGSVKHGRKLDFDILLNPAHTIMGHWNHLGRKLKRLSRRSVAMHVANNDRNHHLTSDVRIYMDGKLVKRQRGYNMAWSECAI